jgi:hypothetical protein
VIDTADAKALPIAVAAFITAVNASDTAGIKASFAEDAIVNDQMQEYAGLRQIAGWADDEILAQQLRVKVLTHERCYSNCIVRAEFEGIFDRRGLPNPLLFVLYFSTAGDKIVQLIVLRASL